MIEDRKNILFGQFSSKLSKNDKDKAWDEICRNAQQLNCIDKNRQTPYFRDVTWQNWRRLSLVHL